MTVFAILMPSSQPGVVKEIIQSFPNDYLALSDTQYFVSALGTAQSVSLKLGLTVTPDRKEAAGSAVVVAISSYWGRAPAEVWDWLKTKLEAPPNG